MLIKNMYDIFVKIFASKIFWFSVFMCFISACCFSSSVYASDICQGMSKKQCEMKYLTDKNFRAQVDNSNIKNGVACPGMNVLKERYQGDCFPCEIVNVLLASFMRAASKVYDVSKEAGNKLLLLGSALWLAFWALQKVSSLANEEPSTMTNELIIFFGKVLVAYCFINSGIGTLVSYAINPILGAGAEFGSAMLLETENIDISSDPAAENQYSGPTDIVSKPVMDKILKLSEGVSNEVATNLIIGSGLTCFSIQNGLHIYVPGIIEINIPDIWLWLCGAAIWCAGFMMVLSVCYYLIDIPFKIGFAIIALPVVIGLWPFKMTSDKLKSVVEIALNAAFTFLFLALSASYAIRLISEAFSAEGDLDINGQTYSGKEALFKAFEVDNVEYVESLFDFTGPAFLIILFCYIYGIKMISSITNDYPGKFASGMTSAAGSPLHHMATAATMWATNKISAPFKTAAQIVAHQAGKAATTATKAAANVGIGAAGAAFGATNKFVGRGINKATAGWVNRQKNLKAAADSLDNYNKMHNAGTATKLQGKLGKISASVGLGLAKSVNKLGKGLEKSGDIMMSPGRDTFSRIASAAKEGGAEIKDAGINLGGALKENVAALAPNKLIKVMKRSPKLGKLADSLMEQKDAMRISAHQDFNKSVKGLTNASSTLAQSATNTFNKSKRGLTNAFSKAKNLHENIKSGAAADKLAALSKKSIKYVTSGSFLKPVGKYYADQYKRTQQDISRSKQNIRGLNTIGQSFKDRISLAGTDLKEAAQSLSPQAFKRNVVNSVNDLRETVDDFRIATERETGLQSNAANTVANLTGISLGIATARNLGRNIRSGVGYVAEGPRNGIAETLGTGVVRPAVALGMTIADTATQTLDSAYNLSEGALLTGISIAQTVTAPVKNIASSLTYGAYAIGDSSLALASVAGDTISVVASRLNVAYQYTKYVTRPLAGTFVGAPLKGVGKTLGFAAKTVDNTLYAGYKAAESLTKGTMQAGNVLVQGANVLYHGVKDRTVVGQAVSKTLKSGSKTLSVAAKTLKLGRNVILAAAGEEIGSKENEAERREQNRRFREERRRQREEERRRERQRERQQEQQERQREQQDLWQQEQDAEAARLDEQSSTSTTSQEHRPSQPRTSDTPPVGDNNRRDNPSPRPQEEPRREPPNNPQDRNTK